MDNDENKTEEQIYEEFSKKYKNAINKLMLDKIIDVSIDINQLFVFASRHNYIEAVKILLNDEKVNNIYYSNQALIETCKYGHIEIVQLLLNHEKINPAS